MIPIGLILLFIYLATLLLFLIGYFRIPVFTATEAANINSFSVIVPFRNEAIHLPDLLTSLQRLQYAEVKFEVIFVDDESTDDSAAIISKVMAKSTVNWKLVQNKRITDAPKKDAITLAISKAAYPWIITTDADCQVPNLWLQGLDRYIQKKDPKMICGPVAVKGKNSLLVAFQKSETISLQGISMGGFGWRRPLLCNGANLAFRKDAFVEVSGYEGNNSIASGDDIFLMEKFRKRFPRQVAFLKYSPSIVTTKAEISWQAVIGQRIRWAAKITKQENTATQITGAIIFSTNLWFVTGFMGLFFEYDHYLYLYFYCFLIKIFADMIFMLMINLFFRSTVNPLWLLINAVLYPFISSGIAIRSLFGRYEWKGRQFKR